MRYVMILAFLCLSVASKADYVNDGRFQYYGRIVYIDQMIVKIQINCTGEVKSFNWNAIVGIALNDQCTHPGYNFSASPVTISEKCKKRTVFTIKFKKLNDVSFADTVALEDGRLVAHFINNKGVLQIQDKPLQAVIEWITFDEKCLDDLKNDFPVPDKNNL